MTFISYAQNFEDITLWRALKFFPKCFYIDVGAYDPTIDSVTKSFYDLGWNGINIDPQYNVYKKFCVERSRDINIHAAVSDVDDETLVLYTNPECSGFSTVEKATEESHRKQGILMTEVPVKTRTLESICQEHVTGQIHFLKIDVEGHEGAVVRGMDFQRWRPWIIIIEMPLSVKLIDDRIFAEDAHPAWEEIILKADYSIAHYDGINRYYIAREHMNLAGAFEIPPCLLDDFKLCRGHHFSYPIADLEDRILREQNRADLAESKLAEIHDSRGWKIIHALSSLKRLVWKSIR
jgi:FkbM family methyltransferase